LPDLTGNIKTIHARHHFIEQNQIDLITGKFALALEHYRIQQIGKFDQSRSTGSPTPLSATVSVYAATSHSAGGCADAHDTFWLHYPFRRMHFLHNPTH
jgi:hypothetical protein